MSEERTEYSVGHKQAALQWPPPADMPLEQKVDILITIVDGMLALLPLGMIDTLRINAGRSLRNAERIDRIERLLKLTPDDQISEVIGQIDPAAEYSYLPDEH